MGERCERILTASYKRGSWLFFLVTEASVQFQIKFISENVYVQDRFNPDQEGYRNKTFLLYHQTHLVLCQAYLSLVTLYTSKQHHNQINITHLGSAGYIRSCIEVIGIQIDSH